MSSILNQQYWNDRYAENATGWDLGEAAPALTNYFNTLKDKDIQIMIPGCGNAYEAEYLLAHGFEAVTLVDISPLLMDQLRRKFARYAGQQLQLVNDDFFNLNGQYDLIIEQTFFCALNPSLRKKYVDQMLKLLKPGGVLAGLLFNREFVSSPPFGGSREEYIQLFSNDFHLLQLEVSAHSVTPRAGTELFFVFQKK